MFGILNFIEEARHYVKSEIKLYPEQLKYKIYFGVLKNKLQLAGNAFTESMDLSGTIK